MTISKFFRSLVVFTLVPALLADPATASAFLVQKPTPNTPLRFQEEAFAPVAEWMQHTLDLLGCALRRAAGAEQIFALADGPDDFFEQAPLQMTHSGERLGGNGQGPVAVTVEDLKARLLKQFGDETLTEKDIQVELEAPGYKTTVLVKKHPKAYILFNIKVGGKLYEMFAVSLLYARPEGRMTLKVIPEGVAASPRQRTLAEVLMTFELLRFKPDLFRASVERNSELLAFLTEMVSSPFRMDEDRTEVWGKIDWQRVNERWRKYLEEPYVQATPVHRAHDILHLPKVEAEEFEPLKQKPYLVVPALTPFQEEILKFINQEDPEIGYTADILLELGQFDILPGKNIQTALTGLAKRGLLFEFESLPHRQAEGAGRHLYSVKRNPINISSFMKRVYEFPRQQPKDIDVLQVMQKYGKPMSRRLISFKLNDWRTDNHEIYSRILVPSRTSGIIHFSGKGESRMFSLNSPGTPSAGGSGGQRFYDPTTMYTPLFWVPGLGKAIRNRFWGFNHKWEAWVVQRFPWGFNVLLRIDRLKMRARIMFQDKMRAFFSMLGVLILAAMAVGDGEPRFPFFTTPPSAPGLALLAPLPPKTMSDLAMPSSVRTDVESYIHQAVEDPELKAVVAVKEGGPRIEIGVDHGSAYGTWYAGLLEGRIRRGSTLIHIDSHPDTAETGFAKEPTTVRDAESTEYDIGSFILPAVVQGLVEDIYWVSQVPDSPEDSRTWVVPLTDEYGMESAIWMHNGGRPLTEEAVKTWVRENFSTVRLLNGKYKNKGKINIHIEWEKVRLIQVHQVSPDQLPDFAGASTILDIDEDYFGSTGIPPYHFGDFSAVQQKLLSALRSKHLTPGVISLALSPGWAPRARMLDITQNLLQAISHFELAPIQKNYSGQPILHMYRSSPPVPELLAQVRASFRQGPRADVFALKAIETILTRYSSQALAEQNLHQDESVFLPGAPTILRSDQPSPAAIQNRPAFNLVAEALYIRSLIWAREGQTSKAAQDQKDLLDHYASALFPAGLYAPAAHGEISKELYSKRWVTIFDLLTKKKWETNRRLDRSA